MGRRGTGDRRRETGIGETRIGETGSEETGVGETGDGGREPVIRESNYVLQ